MAENLKVTLPGGYTLALENVDAAGVPDITQNAGENVQQAEADAQKPVTQEGAEYDAAAEADKGKEIENVQQVASQESFAGSMAIMNENTFYGMTQYQRAQEGFGIRDTFSGLKYKTEDEMWKDQTVLNAIDTAKKWAEKKGFELATKEEVQQNKQTLGTLLFRRAGKSNGGDTGLNGLLNKGKIINVAGATIYSMRTSTSMANTLAGSFGFIPPIIRKLKGAELIVSFIFFKKSDGKIFAKGLAKATVNKAYATESAGIFSEFFARESAAADAGETNPAATDNPVTPAEPDPETETVDVNVEEDVGVTAEPAPAATEPAPETPATEPVPAATEPAPETPATEPVPAATEPAATDDDDAKAVESFYADFFKGWNK